MSTFSSGRERETHIRRAAHEIEQKNGSHNGTCMRGNLSTVAMRLLLICVAFIQVALAEDFTEVSGYVGDTVTLPSGVDPSWELSSITWVIFTNTTLVATCTKGKKNLKGFYRYRGRVQLNSSTGDLTISNLTREDAIQYTVDLLSTKRKNKINTVRLTVKQHLQKPDIKEDFRASTKDGCLIKLHCNSTDEGVSLSWKMDTHLKAYSSHYDGKSAIALAYLNKTQHVEFTCTSRRNATEYISSNVIHSCEEDKPEPTITPSPTPLTIARHSALLFFFGTLILLVVSFLLLYLKAK